MHSIITLPLWRVSYDLAIRIGSALTGTNFSPINLGRSQMLDGSGWMVERSRVRFGPGLGSTLTVSSGQEPMEWVTPLTAEEIDHRIEKRSEYNPLSMSRMDREIATELVLDEELERLAKYGEYPLDARTVITLTSEDSDHYSKTYAEWEQTYMLHMIAQALGVGYSGRVRGPGESGKWVDLSRIYALDKEVVRKDATGNPGRFGVQFFEAGDRMARWMEGRKQL